MNNQRTILIVIIVAIIGAGLIGVYVMRPVPQMIVTPEGGLLWEGFYTTATFYLNPAPELISNRWTYTEVDTLKIDLTIEIGVTDFYGPTEYLTHILFIIKPDKGYHPEREDAIIANFTLVENQRTFTLKGEIFNEIGYQQFYVRMKTLNHPEWDSSILSLVMKGPAYPIQDITSGTWVAIGAVEKEEENGWADLLGDDNGASGFEWLFALIPLLIYKKKRRKKENGKN